MTDRDEGPIGRLPEHLLIDIFVRLPVSEWVQIGCVNKHWESVFQGEGLWQTAIAKKWPSAGFRKRWPGPIPRGSAKRRFQALYVSENFIHSGGEIDELIGHTYLYLKEQFERPTMPPSSILHGTIIDQFIACGKTGDKAHELASKIWLAVIDSLEENHQTFFLLKHLAQEGEFFLPFPYSDHTMCCGGCLTSCSQTSATVSAGLLTMMRCQLPRLGFNQYPQQSLAISSQLFLPL